MTIVVTGVGAVTALGTTAPETFARVLEGRSGIRELALFDPGDVRSRLVAEVREVSAAENEASASRTSELALRAAREALAQARLDVRRRRVGLVLGGTTAGMFETESFLATILGAAPGRERDQALSRMLSHPLSAPTDRLADELGPFCRTRSLSSACSTGANALAIGAAWLELGLVDAVLCGAADALCRVIVAGFNALGIVDPEGARPFDIRRRGLTLGEGAGMVVLERAEDGARERAICTLLGWASRSEAHHITNPDASGDAPLAAMRAALARAGLTPADVDWVNAHGTGTPLNDTMEAHALSRLLGERLLDVPVSSQKGMLGHTLGAAGAIEAVLTALAIERGTVLPTGGLAQPDPGCPLRHVLSAEPLGIDVALSSSFGFGGMDTALVLASRARVAPLASRPRRVVVTGICVASPAGVLHGTDVADLPSRRFDTDARVDLERLDAGRARRLDRASRIGAVVCEGALAEAAGEDVGVVLGVAFGAVDATAAFMRRLREKGPRMVPPADFPSLVPSSPAGHVSIYHRLSGPALVIADLAVSGEGAIAQACELIAAGDAERVCAGAVEERSAIVEEVLSIVFGDGRSEAALPRAEGGAAVSLAPEDAEGVRPLARLDSLVAFGRDDSLDVIRALPPPPDGAVVVLGTEDAAELVRASEWASCARVVCAPGAGTHEAVGAVAVAVAAAMVARGDAPAALFVGVARGRGYAGTLWPPNRAA